MRKKSVVISTLSEDVFTGVEGKLEEIGARIIEKRYDLLYHRYELYTKLDIWQRYKLRHFIKSYGATIMEVGS